MAIRSRWACIKFARNYCHYLFQNYIPCTTHRWKTTLQIRIQINANWQKLSWTIALLFLQPGGKSYSVISYERETRRGLSHQKKEHIRGHLWHVFSVEVNKETWWQSLIFRNDDLNSITRNDDLNSITRNDDLNSITRNDDLNSITTKWF
jgi:hypothetical protein